MLKLKNIVYSLILIVPIVFSSCSKLTIGNKNRVAFVSKKQFIENISKHKDFETINFKRVSVQVFSPESSIKFNSSIKIKKDSIIQISLKPGFGIEALRIGLTVDSVLIINRINKTIIKKSYKFLKNKYSVDLDFFAIQSLLVGEYFSLGCEITEKANIDIQRKENYIVEHYCIENKTFETNTFDDSFRLVAKRVFSKIISSEVQLDYVEFFQEDLIELPKEVKLKIKQKVYNTSINLDVRDVVLNEEINFNLSYSSKYSKVNVN